MFVSVDLTRGEVVWEIFCMGLISEGYRVELERVHGAHPEFGGNRRLVRYVRDLLHAGRDWTVLDYGCGKGDLVRGVRDFGEGQVQGYDPAVVEWSEMPSPADLVVCFDVLEHVEEESVGEVLDHIQGLTRRVFAGVVVLEESWGDLVLSDGRNPHITVKPAEWWLERLRARWKRGWWCCGGKGGRELVFLVGEVPGSMQRVFRSFRTWGREKKESWGLGA